MKSKNRDLDDARFAAYEVAPDIHCHNCGRIKCVCGPAPSWSILREQIDRRRAAEREEVGC